MEALVHRPWNGNPTIEEIIRANYREPLTQARNVVIKAGTDVLLTKEGTLDMVTMSSLIEQIAYLMKKGYRVTYITSGAVAAGKGCLGEKAEGTDPRILSAIGQARLMEVYNALMINYLRQYAEQVLVEKEHFSGIRRKETKQFFDESYERGVLAIVNANDPIWPKELPNIPKRSDNDQIARWVYDLLNADLAIYLTSVEGLMYNFRGENERKIDLALGISHRTYDLVGEFNSAGGTGGMRSKLKRIKAILEEKNGQAVIADGKKPNVILNILNGENEGTYFARGKRLSAYL
ncbi:hypothetical protein KY347_04665 [Candidatus Woesearchaeota archaeon]|nr:hypothetical protein [Candidatus Woesearchaeota archaeon]